MQRPLLPPRQQLAAPGKWPSVGEPGSRTDAAPWTVELTGAVDRWQMLSLADLRALPQVEQAVDIHCVTRWSKLDVRFSGVPLAALVRLAAPEPAARFVSFVARSARRHSTSLVLAEALALETLIALQIDGQPLDDARGGPARVIVPGRYFYKSLKWLERVEFLTEDRPGYWESTAGYHNRGDVWREERYMAGDVSSADALSILATRDISGRELRGLDARGADLDGLMAVESLLRDADFRRSRLEAACFDRANLSNARFDGANLVDASFRDADLEGADFRGADLRGASLAGASLFGATFSDPDDFSGNGTGAIVDVRTQIDIACLESLTPSEYAYLKTALERART